MRALKFSGKHRLIINLALLVIASVCPMKYCGITIPLGYLVLLKLVWSFCDSDVLNVIENEDIEIPFHRDINGLIIVEASFDGVKKRKFLFDTGMSFLCVSNSARSELIKLPGMKTVSPAGKELPCGLLRSFSIDKLTFKLPFALAFAPSSYIQDGELSGIIGSALFTRFEVTIDNGRSVVRLRKPSNERSKNWQSFASKESWAPFMGPNIFIPGTIGAVDAEFYLDSGFNSNLIPPFSATKITGSSVIPMRGIGCEWYKNANIGTFLAHEINVGNTAFSNIVFYVVLPDRNWSLLGPVDTQVVLGNWFFRRTKAISIDYQNKKVLVE